MEKIAVVTGGSGGIGKACCKRLSLGGYKVFNLSRHGEDTDCSEFISTDVTDELSLQHTFDIIADRYGKIDILINNAGYGIAGAAEFTPTEQAKRQFDVNFFGAFSCTKAALPYIRAAKGKIAFISSAAALFSIPFQSFYSASKSAVNSLSQAWASELSAFGISVTSFMLGDAKTGFTDARVKEFKGDDVYGGVIARSVAVMENDEQNGMSPDKIADYIFKKLSRKKPKTMYTVGFSYKFLAFASRFLSSSFINKAIRALYIKKG